MALLQISEPGMSPAPHQHRLAVGIDLGTTNSLVATVKNGSVDCIAEASGAVIMPSVVAYRDNETLVGEAAVNVQLDNPANTIFSVKRLMGRGLNDITHRQNLPYNFVASDGMVRLQTVRGIKTPVEISAEILRQLRLRAEDSLGGTLTGAVITVPAYFDDAQRQATKDAAELAGINVLRLLNEPTAAAVAYGLDNGSEGVYAVYDLGGGTFDISILRLSKGVFEVLATNGDASLGGDDFDHCIYQWIIQQSGIINGNARDARMLLSLARQAKEQLTGNDSASIQASMHDGQKIELILKRQQFVELTMALVNKTIAPARRALRDAGLTAAEIRGVVMVGGATRMPHVQQAVGGFFACQPLNNLDPDKVVALGAALQANALAGNRNSDDDWLLLDVIPLSLGIETVGALVEKIIPRNATIPISKTQEFTTFKDGQTAMSVHVLQGERELVADCRSLARFELRGIPPMLAGATRIRVTFQVDADGLLSVTAEEQSAGVSANVVVKPSYGLSDDEIAEMLKASFNSAESDMRERALREQRVEAERLQTALNDAIAKDGDLLDSKEHQVLFDASAELAQLAVGVDHRAIRRAIENLAALSDDFAARRMDRQVRKTLTGVKVSDLEH